MGLTDRAVASEHDVVTFQVEGSGVAASGGIADICVHE